VGRSAAVTAAGGVYGFLAELTSFIGRAGTRSRWLLEQSRLVTVTGPGDAGKTRLAGQVARRVAGRFADGAWLVELAPVGSPYHPAKKQRLALGLASPTGCGAAPRPPGEAARARRPAAWRGGGRRSTVFLMASSLTCYFR
jgi:hypothetical protein